MRLGARPATEDEIALVHAPRPHRARGGDAPAGRAWCFDPDTSTSPGSYEAARLAAGSLLAVCEAVLAGEVRERRSRSCARPAITPSATARWASASSTTSRSRRRGSGARGIARVAIIDWDVHHGNGTQHLFEDDPSVLYVSTHQFPCYPGTGAADEVGRGAGAGRTLNLPFPPGFGDAEYARAFDEVVAADLPRSSRPTSCSCRPASTATAATRSAAWP